MKPSNFVVHPWSSVFQNAECEVVARNIMSILYTTGDNWRELSEQEYEEVRKQDEAKNPNARYADWAELPIFRKVVQYTVSAQKAAIFSPTWEKIYKGEPDED